MQKTKQQQLLNLCNDFLYSVHKLTGVDYTKSRAFSITMHNIPREFFSDAKKNVKRQTSDTEAFQFDEEIITENPLITILSRFEPIKVEEVNASK
jgi:hypothetical protein